VPKASDEGAIDLDLVDRKLSQPPQAGIAGSEVVDRDSHTLCVQSVQIVQVTVARTQEQAFGNLQL
jgi:hypothetical protein